MKRSRKLAWVVLGVVVLGTVGFFAWLSTLYSPWEPGGEILQLTWDGQPCGISRAKVCHQRFPWLPGQDRVLVEVSEEEFLALHGPGRGVTGVRVPTSYGW